MLLNEKKSYRLDRDAIKDLICATVDFPGVGVGVERLRDTRRSSF